MGNEAVDRQQPRRSLHLDAGSSGTDALLRAPPTQPSFSPQSSMSAECRAMERHRSDWCHPDRGSLIRSFVLLALCDVTKSAATAIEGRVAILSRHVTLPTHATQRYDGMDDQ